MFPARQEKLPETCYYRFASDWRSQLVIGVHNEAFSVAAICICNQDRRAVADHGSSDTAHPLTGFAALLIVSNDLRCWVVDLKPIVRPAGCGEPCTDFLKLRCLLLHSHGESLQPGF